MKRMLKMSRVCTLAEMLSKIFGKKRKGNLGPYLQSWFLGLHLIEHLAMLLTSTLAINC